MTLRLYAERKKWPLRHVGVQLRHDRIHAHDSRECKAPSCRIERIERIVSLDGPLTDDQRHRLIEIAERCPVHRTLIGEKQILTRLDSVGAMEAESSIAGNGNGNVELVTPHETS